MPTNPRLFSWPPAPAAGSTSYWDDLWRPSPLAPITGSPFSWDQVDLTQWPLSGSTDGPGAAPYPGLVTARPDGRVKTEDLAMRGTVGNGRDFGSGGAFAGQAVVGATWNGGVPTTDPGATSSLGTGISPGVEIPPTLPGAKILLDRTTSPPPPASVAASNWMKPAPTLDQPLMPVSRTPSAPQMLPPIPGLAAALSPSSGFVTPFSPRVVSPIDRLTPTSPTGRMENMGSSGVPGQWDAASAADSMDIPTATGLSNLVQRAAITGAYGFDKAVEGISRFAGLNSFAEYLRERTEKQASALRGEPQIGTSGQLERLGAPSHFTQVAADVGGGFIANAPASPLGPISSQVAIGLQMIGQAGAEAYDRARGQGASDAAASHAAGMAALQTLPSTLLMAAMGAGASKVVKKVVPLEASPLARAATALVVGTGSNVAAGVLGRAVVGHDFTPTTTDVVNGMIAALPGARHGYQLGQDLATARSVLDGTHPEMVVLNGVAEGAGGRATPPQQTLAAQYANALRAVAAKFVEQAGYRAPEAKTAAPPDVFEKPINGREVTPAAPGVAQKDAAESPVAEWSNSGGKAFSTPARSLPPPRSEPPAVTPSPIVRAPRDSIDWPASSGDNPEPPKGQPRNTLWPAFAGPKIALAGSTAPQTLPPQSAAPALLPAPVRNASSISPVSLETVGIAPRAPILSEAPLVPNKGAGVPPAPSAAPGPSVPGTTVPFRDNDFLSNAGAPQPPISAPQSAPPSLAMAAETHPPEGGAATLAPFSQSRAWGDLSSPRDLGRPIETAQGYRGILEQLTPKLAVFRRIEDGRRYAATLANARLAPLTPPPPRAWGDIQPSDLGAVVETSDGRRGSLKEVTPKVLAIRPPKGKPFGIAKTEVRVVPIPEIPGLASLADSAPAPVGDKGPANHLASGQDAHLIASNGAGTNAEEEPLPPGWFRITDWTGYPDGVPRPSGPFRLLSEAEYEVARDAADRANHKLHDANPPLKGFEIHEIHPIKFGGSPADVANKMPLSPKAHYELNAWWRALQKKMTKIQLP